jgi:epoxide hydrolase-like predicted phosphatase
MDKKTLIIDCFGVVASTPSMSWINDNLGVEFDKKDLLKRANLGEIPEEDVFLKLSTFVNRSPSAVREEIDGYFKLNEELIAYLKELKLKKYKIILLTNANHTFFERFIFVKYPWFRDLFDDIIISSKIKMLKPSNDIFLYVLKQSNLKPEEVIFIDDSQSNIVVAQNMGIQSVLFENTKQLKAELLKYNID